MSKSPSKAGEFTGRHMLAIMVAFFGVIITVNITMAMFATTTWSGFVVRNSHIAGLEFNDKAAAAQAQAALGWTSQTTITDGRISFTVRDADGAQVALADGTATFRRPVSDTEDTVSTLSPGPDGSLVGAVTLRDGSWIVEFNINAATATPWHEMKRLLLREGQSK